MTWEEVKELAPLYAIGALDEVDVSAIEGYLHIADADEQREILAWQEVAAMLPFALPQPTVSPHLKTELLRRIAIAEPSRSQDISPNVLPFRPAQKADSQTTRPTTRQATRWFLMAATLALTFSSSYLLWQNVKLIGERDRVIREIEQVLSPSTRVIAMVGEEAPQASAKVLWDTSQNKWRVIVYNLPEAPSNQDYQLWYVTKDAKISAIIFRPNDDGQAEMTLSLPQQAITGLVATAVTLEPKGGSLQPTGKFYLKAAI